MEKKNQNQADTSRANQNGHLDLLTTGWLWNLGREVVSFSPHQPHIKFKHDEMKRGWRVARAGTG
jgi:hypothetical protein